MRNSAELISKQVMSEMLCDVVGLTEDPIVFDVMVCTVRCLFIHMMSDHVSCMEAVVAPCGHSFSSHSIRKWLQQNNSCPRCKSHISRDTLAPNYYTLRDLIAAIQRSISPNICRNWLSIYLYQGDDCRYQQVSMLVDVKGEMNVFILKKNTWMNWCIFHHLYPFGIRIHTIPTQPLHCLFMHLYKKYDHWRRYKWPTMQIFFLNFFYHQLSDRPYDCHRLQLGTGTNPAHCNCSGSD